MSAYQYFRARITGQLSCCTAMHVGSGDSASFKQRNPLDINGDPLEQPVGEYNTVKRGYGGRPMIPGSTLRGSLAAMLDPQCSDHRLLFGFQQPAGEDKSGKRQSGLLTVLDAPMVTDNPQAADAGWSQLPFWSQETNTFIAHGIAIDAVTATVEKGKLFRYEMVPPSVRFSVCIELVRVTEAQLALMLGLLEHWDGSAATAMGKGRSKGYGRVKWHNPQLAGCTKSQMAEWLSGPETLDLPIQALPLPAPGPVAGPRRGPRFPFKLAVYPAGPLLINEPAMVSQRKNDPKLVCNRVDNRATIPGTSMAGLLRARAAKIISSIACQYVPNASAVPIATLAEQLTGEVFGSQARASMLGLTAAVDVGEQSSEHKQTFNAIDRFTGGVMEAALLTVLAVRSNQLITGPCYLDRHFAPEGNWWKGLLLLLSRDFVQADMSVGWGKGRGYGAVTGAIYIDDSRYDNWPALRDRLEQQFNRQTLQSWLDELHNKIQKLALEPSDSDRELAQ